MNRGRRPNAPKHHNPDPDYIASLLLAICRPIGDTARRLGISSSQLRRYKTKGKSGILCPYPVQFTLESMAECRAHDSDVYRTKKRPRGKIEP